MSGSLEIQKRTFKDKNILVFDREGDEIAFKVSTNFKG